MSSRKTKGASFPFWSPDSQFIAFFAQGKLKKIAVSGVPPQTLCDAQGGRGGTWNRGDVIVFAPGRAAGLFQVPASGGTPRPVTTVDRSRQEVGHLWPHSLPDGRSFLYSVINRDGHADVYAGSPNLKSSTLVLRDGAAAIYAQGYLVFIRDNVLIAQRFDPVRIKLAGDDQPVRLAERIESGRNGGWAFTTSDNGALAYRSGAPREAELAWFDRTGKLLETIGPSGTYDHFSLSPDGKSLAATRLDPYGGISNLWLTDLSRATTSRFTFDSGQDTSPVWSPDSRQIAFIGVSPSLR